MSATVEMIRCAGCGAINRVQLRKTQSGLAAVCGQCAAPLSPPVGRPVVVSDDTFEREVAGSSVPVLVDAWAPWCAPCRRLAPTLEAVAAEMGGRLKVAKLNVDENPATASRLGVYSIPTMILFKEGAEVDRMVGALPKEAILERLETLP